MIRAEEYIGRVLDSPGKPKADPKRRAQRGGRTAGRFAVLNTFVDFTMRGMRRNELAVWLVLYRDSRDGIARTGQADIAKRIGASVRTVRRALGRLERRGLLVIVHRGRIGHGPSAYRVRGIAEGEARRTKLCPVVGGQNGASTEDRAVSAIPEGTRSASAPLAGGTLKKKD